MKLRFCGVNVGCFQIWMRFHNATQYSVLYNLAPAGTVGLAPTCISLLSCTRSMHAQAVALRTLSPIRTHSLKVSLSLSLIMYMCPVQNIGLGEHVS